jgi:cation diffusion facilitator family transporter
MENFAGVRFVLIYTMILNLVVTVAKVVVGFLTGSLSIIADGVDSLFDSVSNVLGLIAIYLARRPPDEDHPYGHRRYEILITGSISVLLFITCAQILRSAYQRWLHPTVTEVNIWSFLALGLSIVVHVYVAIYEKRRGHELRSEFLVADAAHTSADILVTVGVAAGLILVRQGYAIVDTLMAVVIAALIAKIGVNIIGSTARILVDGVAVDSDRVKAVLAKIPEVESYHRIRSRGQEDDLHMDLHIRVQPNMPLAQAHRVAHNVRDALQAEIPGLHDVIVHVEPEPGRTVLSQSNLFADVREVARRAGVTVHHVNACEIAGQYSIELHLEVSSGLTLGEAHSQANWLEERIKAEIPTVVEVSTHIEPMSLSPTEQTQDQADDAIRESVLRLAAAQGSVDCHDVKIRRQDGKVFVTMDCGLEAGLSVTEAHEIASRIEDGLRSERSEIDRVTIHMEPLTNSST